MAAHSRYSLASLVVASTLALAGCANDNMSGLLPTGSIGGESEGAKVAQTSRIDPACVTLTSQIDTLRKEGIAEKVEKASQKKHKLTSAELAKADQLNKANAEFQTKCSSLTPQNQQAAAAPKPAQ